MQASFTRAAFVIFFLSVSSVKVFPQQEDYRKIFEADWKKASDYVSENKVWMEPLLKKNNIPFPVAIAVIFPELVRYSALRDKMEVTLLKALYVNLGDDYADFSIGVFQMKPSFAMTVRDQAKIFPAHRLPGIFRQKPDPDIKNFRKQIICELEDPHTQLDYLIAFIRICEKKYGVSLKNEEASIKFLSTAYNTGICKSRREIESMIEKRFFNASLIKAEKYPYADVSLSWYNNQQVEK